MMIQNYVSLCVKLWVDHMYPGLFVLWTYDVTQGRYSLWNSRTGLVYRPACLYSSFVTDFYFWLTIIVNRYCGVHIANLEY